MVKIKKLRRYKRFALEEVAEIEIKLKFEIFFALEEVAESKKDNKKPSLYFLYTNLSPENYKIIFKMNMKIILILTVGEKRQLNYLKLYQKNIQIY